MSVNGFSWKNHQRCQNEFIRIFFQRLVKLNVNMGPYGKRGHVPRLAVGTLRRLWQWKERWCPQWGFVFEKVKPTSQRDEDRRGGRRISLLIGWSDHDGGDVVLTTSGCSEIDPLNGKWRINDILWFSQLFQLLHPLHRPSKHFLALRTLHFFNKIQLGGHLKCPPSRTVCQC